jgi:glucose/arabinose dehydrogenase
MRTLTLAMVMLVAGSVGTSAQAPPAPAPPPDCSPAGNVRFVCGQQAPEDLVVVPGGQWVIAGAYGGSGGIYLIRASDKASSLAYPTATARDRFDAKTYAGCPGAPDAAAKAKFQTHGLSLQTGQNSVHRLFVVLHGPRESIEVFEVDARQATPTLTWIGCAVAPDPIGLNSVRWLPDGGFIATNFLPRGNPAGMKTLQGGANNGELWEWHTASGWQKVPGSESSGANGLEISEDGRQLYVAAWGSQSFFRLSRGQTPPVREEVKLGFRVDNIRWASDGSILAAGQGGTPPSYSSVVKIDPKTLAVREILRHPNTPAFSNGTVAVEVGKELWVGTFRGDRLAVFPLPSGSASNDPVAPVVFDTATGQKIRVHTVATGLVNPWSVAFTDARTMLVTERPGRLRVVRDGVLLPQPAWTAPAPPRGSDALHFVAVHPDFATNRLVYVSYPKYTEQANTLAIARGTFDGTTLSGVKEIFVADAWETSGNIAGRIFFAPDRTLYVTVGDRDRLCCIGKDDNSLRMKAQMLDNHVGKTLRLRDDGSAPPDNPFVGRAGAKPEIFTYGHRNGYGLAINPATGELWQAEIGPLGGDEVNILLPGHNYGWPLVSMGRNYTGTLVSDEPFWRKGMDNARMFWVPSISPSSLMFYDGDRFKGWKGSLFVGALNGKALVRVSFNQPSQAERRELLLVPLNIRVRDVTLGPNGDVYVATERASGNNQPDGTVLRIEPVLDAGTQ